MQASIKQSGRYCSFSPYIPSSFLPPLQMRSNTCATDLCFVLCYCVCNIVLRYVNHWTDKRSNEICLDLHGQDVMSPVDSNNYG